MDTMSAIPIIDCSGSMQGVRMSAVDGSMREMCKSLMDVSSLKFGKLFADRCRAYLKKLLPQ